jgi:hypothetical protein
MGRSPTEVPGRNTNIGGSTGILQQLSLVIAAMGLEDHSSRSFLPNDCVLIFWIFWILCAAMVGSLGGSAGQRILTDSQIRSHG